MLRKRFFPLCCALLLVLLTLTGCGIVSAKPDVSPSPSQTETPSPSGEPSPPDESFPDMTGRAFAYFLVFEQLLSVDPGLNDGITYLAVDLSSVLSKEKDAIAELFENYCKEKSLTLLLSTYAELVEQGYITNDAFEDGLFVRYEDEDLTDNTLVTRAQKWRAGDGADGAVYTVTRSDAIWEITEIAGMWIS